MKVRSSQLRPRVHQERGSVLIIVLWVAFGLVAITLYFANSMSLELRASDNRVCALAADQAIEGGVRYASYVLANYGTNGVVPDPTTYSRDAVPVGDARFWFIGRNPDPQARPTQPFFALTDENAKLNLNTVSSNVLEMVPNITLDLLSAILEWRNTNSSASLTYAMLHPPYQCKSASFETVDELHLVNGAKMDLLVGEDANRNGVLDPNEIDDNRNGTVDPGLLEYFTIWSREPTAGRTNLNNANQLFALLQQTLGTARATAIRSRVSPRPPAPPLNFRSPLQFYLASGMKSDEFALIGTNVTIATNGYIKGRVNVNTASPTVLSCLPGMTVDLAQQLVTYRQSNPNNLSSVAWIVDALGQNNASVLQALAMTDCITTQSYQFSADVAALGPYGRGYRRVRFVIDMSDGTPRIVYRQDLSHLGWALGKEVRDTQFLAKTTR